MSRDVLAVGLGWLVRLLWVVMATYREGEREGERGDAGRGGRERDGGREGERERGRRGARRERPGKS